MSSNERRAEVVRLNRLLEAALDNDLPTDCIQAERALLKMADMPNYLKNMYRREWPVVIVYNGHHGSEHHIASNPDEVARVMLGIMSGLLATDMLSTASPFDVQSIRNTSALITRALDAARDDVEGIPFTGNPVEDLVLLRQSKVMDVLSDSTIGESRLVNEVGTAKSARWLYATTMALRDLHMNKNDGSEPELRATIEAFLRANPEAGIPSKGLRAIADSCNMSIGDRAAAILLDFKAGMNLRLAGRQAQSVLEDDESMDFIGESPLSAEDLLKSVEGALANYQAG